MTYLLKYLIYNLRLNVDESPYHSCFSTHIWSLNLQSDVLRVFYYRGLQFTLTVLSLLFMFPDRRTD
jgi:hypothetical protein